MFDQAKIQKAITAIIKAIGEDPERESLAGTPERVAEMYVELFAGMGKDPSEELSVGFELGHREMVILRDIPFYSMCEHHLLPFYGVAHIGYIPNNEGRIVGRQAPAAPGKNDYRDCGGDYYRHQTGRSGRGNSGGAHVHDYAWYQETGQ